MNPRPSLDFNRTVRIRAEVFDWMLQLLLGRVFSEEVYLSAYPDVEKDVRAGRIESGFVHFVQQGYFEGRESCFYPVDEQWYLETNTDVAAAIAAGKFTSGKHHFQLIGWTEGRSPSPVFERERSQWEEILRLTDNYDVDP